MSGKTTSSTHIYPSLRYITWESLIKFLVIPRGKRIFPSLFPRIFRHRGDATRAARWVSPFFFPLYPYTRTRSPRQWLNYAELLYVLYIFYGRSAARRWPAISFSAARPRPEDYYFTRDVAPAFRPRWKYFFSVVLLRFVDVPLVLSFSSARGWSKFRMIKGILLVELPGFLARGAMLFRQHLNWNCEAARNKIYTVIYAANKDILKIQILFRPLDQV